MNFLRVFFCCYSFCVCFSLFVFFLDVAVWTIVADGRQTYYAQTGRWVECDFWPTLMPNADIYDLEILINPSGVVPSEYELIVDGANPLEVWDENAVSYELRNTGSFLLMGGSRPMIIQCIKFTIPSVMFD